MNILILGSGGREHALAWKIVQSPQCTKLFIAPGNPGTATLGTNVNISVNEFDMLATYIFNKHIGMVVVGPEDPLVNGITDFLRERFGEELIIVGPGKTGAQLEGSKDYAKSFMARHNIPTAAYQTFTSDSLEAGYQFIDTLKPPYVLKADGLAAGKGVLILQEKETAKAELENMLVGQKFGNASAQVVIEEFLDGVEFSVFALTDGENYVLLPEAKDYKRIGEGDTGLNTGGMGAISPVPFVDDEMWQKVHEQIVEPTVRGLAEENIKYCGFIFFGLINVGGEPKVIEYNVRMGDPETEVVLPRLDTDLVDLFKKMHRKKLNKAEVQHAAEVATTVMVVSGGYPEGYQKGEEIVGLKNVDADVMVFHAGTATKDDKLVTNGGRVMAFTALGNSKEKALQKSYSAINKICFNGIYYRKDIGFDV